MRAVNKSIIVRVDLSQKDEIAIGGNTFKTGKNYNENFRERNPVIAYVVTGAMEIPTGSYIVCNYNYFDIESPLQLTDNLFSIPVDEEIFAVLGSDGELIPICGNVLVERVTKETTIELPEELKQPHANQGIVSKDGNGYKRGQYVFWLPFSDYEIVYSWNEEEKRAIKVYHKEIVGVLKN